MSEDLFEDTNDDAPVIDPEKNYFEEFVGEGKKYKDTVAAGRALLEKDLFIEQLKREAEEARQELRSRLSVEEALTKLQERQTDRSGEATSHHGEPGEGTQTKSTEVDIDKLVEEKLTARERASQEAARKQKEQQNLDSVRQRLTEVYGPNYAAEVKRKAQELGVSTQFLTEAGAREPNALFKLLEVDNQRGYRDITDAAPPASRVNTTATTRADSGVRNSAYYEKLKKEDPKRFWTQQVQAQRHKDALQLGEKFFQ